MRDEKEVDVGGGRVWRLETKSLRLGEQKVLSKKQVVVPVEMLEGMAPEEVGTKVLELADEAQRLYIEYWANLFTRNHFTFNMADPFIQARAREILGGADLLRLETEDIAKLRQDLRSWSISHKERLREEELENLQSPETQRLVSLVAQRVGENCNQCGSSENLLPEQRPESEWPQKKGRKKGRNDYEDPNYYRLICLDCCVEKYGRD